MEDGPWPGKDDDWDGALTRIQHKVFTAIDAALGGQVAEKYPDSIARRIRIQIDSPAGCPDRVSVLVQKIREYLEEENNYSFAIKTSELIRGVRVMTGHEMGRFKKRAVPDR